ncbi:MAG: VWA domain-containing protein, partial [Spirochaetia bacterium]|nr:VWA domain-containing protein [Spirochaetia bacterium]
MFNSSRYSALPGILGIAAALLFFAASPLAAENRIEIRSIDVTGFPLVRLNGIVKNLYLAPAAKGVPIVSDARGPEITESVPGETKRGEIKAQTLDTSLRLVILIDSTKSVPPKQFQASLRTAADMVNKLAPGDQAAVFKINGTPSLIQEFTGSKDRLTAAINGIQRTGMQTKIFDALYSGIQSAREAKHRTG